MFAEQARAAGRTKKIVNGLLPGGFLLVVFCLIAYAYAPSLRHGPRCDHWCFLLDTVEYDDFAGVAAHCWSYSRTRFLSPGDASLFRPLLFVLMAAEKTVFNTHFRAWQLAAIGLHGVVGALLFLILRRVRTSFVKADAPHSPVDLIPYVLTLFFTVNFAVVEQVIWSHITGYLLFTVLVLAALLLLVEAVVVPELPRRRAGRLLATVWLLILAASFTYELGQFCAVCIGLFLVAAKRHEGRPPQGILFLTLFAAIVVLYQSANRLDRWYHRGTYRDDLATSEMIEQLPRTGENLGRYLSYALVQPFLPMHCPSEMQKVGRLWLAEQLWDGLVSWDATAVCGIAIVGLGIALGLFGLGCLLRAGGRRGAAAPTGDATLNPRAPTPFCAPALRFAYLCFAIGACHIALIVLGRLNLRPDSLVQNSYYTYMTLLFLGIGGAVPLLGLDRMRSTWPAIRIAVLTLLAGLVALSVLNLDVTRRINVQAAPLFQSLRTTNAALGSFIRQHEEEPNFRLAVVRGPSDPEHFIATALIFYHRYLDARRPTYLVALERGRPTFTSIGRWRSEHPGEEPDCYPDLIGPRPDFFIFRADHRYYAIPHRWFNRFLAARDRSGFSPSRPSLSELLALPEVNQRKSKKSRKN